MTIDRNWRRLAAFDLDAIRLRWKSSPARDPLKRKKRRGIVADFNADSVSEELVWTAKRYEEYIRLVGALQHRNPDLDLWFRGEPHAHEHACPRAMRGNAEWKKARNARRQVDRLIMKSRRSKDSLIRDRSRLARLAILQHYGAGSPFLDVSRDPHVALAFALWKWKGAIGKRVARGCKTGEHAGFVSVFATPRLRRAVEVNNGLGICVVDLMAELPSHCLRPHVQRAAFLGSQDVLSMFLGDGEYPAEAASELDHLRIARIRVLAGEEAFEGLPGGKAHFERLYPLAASNAQRKGRRAKVDGDYLLAVLQENDKKVTLVPRFPDDRRRR